MAYLVKSHVFLTQFTCLGKECPDSCCVGWALQVDKKTQALYAEKAPELLSAVELPAQVMKQNPVNGACVKLSEGLCSIHRQYGTDFLNDSCHFYPRMIRHDGTHAIMTAALSCPEITRLILFSDHPFACENITLDRLPTHMVTTVPLDLHREKAALAQEQVMLRAGDAAVAPEQSMLSLLFLAETLQKMEVADWPEHTLSLLPQLANKHIQAESKHTDPFCVFYALCLLLAAAPTKNPRLLRVISQMEKALDCSMNWDTKEMAIGKDTLARSALLEQRWQQQSGKWLAPVLHRWIQAQLSMTAFPFGKYVSSLWERSILLVLHFVTLKLALMCHVAEDGSPPDEATVIFITQSLSRFLNHLEDKELSLLIYRDAGWLQLERIAGLLKGVEA